MSRKMNCIARHFISFMACLFVLAGCGSSPPQRFYTLGPASDPAPASQALYSIAVGPVTVPMMVDRPQMVLNAGSNRVTLAEELRWAEPLKESIPRLIAADFTQMIPDAFVSVYPQAVTTLPDYRVSMDIQRFESTPDVDIAIEVLWAVDARDGSRITGRTFKREPAQGKGYESLVSAHQRALAAVSTDIANVIKENAMKSAHQGALAGVNRDIANGMKGSAAKAKSQPQP